MKLMRKSGWRSIMTGWWKRAGRFILWFTISMYICTTHSHLARLSFRALWNWRAWKRTSTTRHIPTISMGSPRNCVSNEAQCFIVVLLMDRNSSNHLNSVIGAKSQNEFKRPIFTSDVAVQTESSMGIDGNGILNDAHSQQEGDEHTLSASDLASILKWSKDISSDINLSSGENQTEFSSHTFWSESS